MLQASRRCVQLWFHHRVVFVIVHGHVHVRVGLLLSRGDDVWADRGLCELPVWLVLFRRERQRGQLLVCCGHDLSCGELECDLPGVSN